MIKRIFTGDTIDLRTIQSISPIRMEYKDSRNSCLKRQMYSVTITLSNTVIVHEVRSSELLVEVVGDLIDDWFEAVIPPTVIIPQMSSNEFDSIIGNLAPLYSEEYKEPKKKLRLNYLSCHYDKANSEIYRENTDWVYEKIEEFRKDDKQRAEELFMISDVYREKFVPLINQRIKDLEK